MNTLYSHTDNPFAPQQDCQCGYAGMGSTFITAEGEANPGNDWSCNDWMIYHKRLVEKYGREGANELWMREWSKQGPFDRSTNFCKYEGPWVNYFQSQGLDLRSIISMVFTGTGNVIDNVVGTAEGVSKAGRNTANTLKWALPVAILVVGGGFIWYLSKNRQLVTSMVTSKLK